MIKKSFNSLLSSTSLPILVLTAFVCLIILPSDVICSTKMHKQKSLYSSALLRQHRDYPNSSCCGKEKKKQRSKRIVFISSARTDGEVILLQYTVPHLTQLFLTMVFMLYFLARSFGFISCNKNLLATFHLNE